MDTHTLDNIIMMKQYFNETARGVLRTYLYLIIIIFATTTTTTIYHSNNK